MRNGQSYTDRKSEQPSISNVYEWVKNFYQRVKSEIIVKSLKNVALAMHYMEVKMTFYLKKVTNQMKTTVKMISVALTTIFLVSIMNKFYYDC
jgi:DNA integrity scanning protein DisA with diadenylate cyclase activity